ncbi:hypothetical protein HYO05_22970 [Vibrio parahaemolyticus]|uniref:hypothetical protein n=1 Tax=Vibrio parahaemolyticus TaxID=670 RepID=UPI00084A964D|nr:hypothetical protein [Vibrio parahaemolyticus]EGQ8047561.1 hypothetical protein [Vibrio parahaemolyticus]EHH2867046.1 hypothetical protein [Vibrio parahaemolyticus]ELA9316616.1 hypothetical protein [Vibrio parahaemolyticus]MBM5036924.1 hypothetical protein [Vibrio parahaemolyticus]MBM5050630.1 hypothetical protein [Vibrio parahaemolyticus]
MSDLPTVPNQDQDLNQLAEQAKRLSAEMKERKIKKVEFEGGPYAEHDSTTNTTIVAGPGAIVEDSPEVTSVHIVKPGVDPKVAAKKLAEKGQKQVVLAAVQETSQPTISNQLSSPEA